MTTYWLVFLRGRWQWMPTDLHADFLEAANDGQA
jgi:hypothetical protein